MNYDLLSDLEKKEFINKCKQKILLNRSKIKNKTSTETTIKQ